MTYEAKVAAAADMYISRTPVHARDSAGNQLWTRKQIVRAFLAGNAAVIREDSPAPISQMVGSVKPLEWTEAALRHSFGLVIRIGQTPFGAYHILEGSQGKFEVYFTTVPLSGAIDDEEEALAWAQSDYERRIRAALSAPDVTNHGSKSDLHPEYVTKQEGEE